MDFLGADKSIVQRSQYFNYEVLNERPVKLTLCNNIKSMNIHFNSFIIKIQYSPYFTMDTFSTVLKVIIAGLAFTRLAHFRLGRKILLKVNFFYSLILIIFVGTKILISKVSEIVYVWNGNKKRHYHRRGKFF